MLHLGRCLHAIVSDPDLLHQRYSFLFVATDLLASDDAKRLGENGADRVAIALMNCIEAAPKDKQAILWKVLLST